MDGDVILDRVAKGAVLKRDGDGVCRLGRRLVSGEMLAALLAAELLRPLAGGRFALSTAGTLRVRRTRLRKGGTEKGAEDEGFRARHQLRARRRRGDRRST